jgi:hypothetical protein
VALIAFFCCTRALQRLPRSDKKVKEENARIIIMAKVHVQHYNTLFSSIRGYAQCARVGAAAAAAAAAASSRFQRFR